MKRRIQSILLTLCMVLCLLPASVVSAAAATVDSTAKAVYEQLVRDGALDGAIPFNNFVDVSKHESGSDIEIGNDGVYFITGSVTFTGKNPGRIRVKDNVQRAFVYFYNCHMDYSQCKNEYAPVTVDAGGNASFHFLGDNTFIGSKKRAGIEKNHKSGSTLTLYLWDDCNVTAIGGEFAAGIGSSYQKDAGGIVIEAQGTKGNGKLTAKGTKGALNEGDVGGAGIGGSADGSAYNITINGGVVEARGAVEAAGIGGGYNGNCSNVRITGGKVDASSEKYGAGIGTGCASKNRADKQDWLLCEGVYISGGDVTARGGNSLTAAIGGGVGGRAKDIQITGGDITAVVNYQVHGRVIGGGQDCTEGGDGTEDLSENLTASLSADKNKGQYYDVTFVTEPGMSGSYADKSYRIYPGETFDIEKEIHSLYVIKPEGSSRGTGVPIIQFKLVTCQHTKKHTTDEGTYLVSTDYYTSVGEDRVRMCDECGSVLDFDNTYPTVEGEFSNSMVGDWTFRVKDPEPETTNARTVSYTNRNGNTVEFTVFEAPSGIAKVLLDGKELSPNEDGSYTVPADSADPDNIKRHTLTLVDRAGRGIEHKNIRVYEPVTITAYCDGEQILVNGQLELVMGKGWTFRLREIRTLNYKWYYDIYLNGEFFGTCLQEADLGRITEDTRLDLYTREDGDMPTGKIAVGGNSWTGFDDSRPNTEVAVNNTEKVTVTAEDAGSGVETVQYLISDSILTAKQLESETNWTDYAEPFALPEGSSYVYVKVTDKTGSTSYLNSAAIRTVKNPVTIDSVSGNPDKWQANPAELRLTVSGDAGIRSAIVYADGCTTGESCTVSGNEVSFTAKKSGSYRFVVTDHAGNTAEKLVEVTRIDTSVPTVTYTADEDTPRQSASVALTVADSPSGYKLYLSHNGKAEQELTDLTLTVTENGTYTVRAVNGAGTEHSVTFSYEKLDREAPRLAGLEDGKIYCGAVTFRVEDESAVTVTVDGKTLLPDNGGAYTVAPAAAPQTVTVTDAAGNETAVSITVNTGHTWGDWTQNGDTRTRECTVDGCTETETEKITPRTGDDSHAVLWLAVSLASAAAAVAVVIGRRKRDSVE